MYSRTFLIVLVAAACSPLAGQPGSNSAYNQQAAANPCNVDPNAPICLLADRDNDRVPDARDVCPDTAGSANGCPDADGDMVADASDRCPDTKESANGLQDDDGCPDELPTDDPMLARPFVVEEMPPGQSKLDGTTRLALDDYAIVLRKAESTRLKIRGYTDDREAPSDAARQQLGLKRAEAVRDYMVKKWGIDPGRIEVAGVGAGEPAAHNGGSGGRAKNRRVEIVVSSR